MTTSNSPFDRWHFPIFSSQRLFVYELRRKPSRNVATWNDSHQEPELNLGLPEYGKHSGCYRNQTSLQETSSYNKTKHIHLEPCPYPSPATSTLHLSQILSTLHTKKKAHNIWTETGKLKNIGKTSSSSKGGRWKKKSGQNLPKPESFEHFGATKRRWRSLSSPPELVTSPMQEILLIHILYMGKVIYIYILWIYIYT